MNLEKLTLEDYEQVKNLSKKYKLDVLKKMIGLVYGEKIHL